MAKYSDMNAGEFTKPKISDADLKRLSEKVAVCRRSNDGTIHLLQMPENIRKAANEFTKSGATVDETDLMPLVSVEFLSARDAAGGPAFSFDEVYAELMLLDDPEVVKYAVLGPELWPSPGADYFIGTAALYQDAL